MWKPSCVSALSGHDSSNVRFAPRDVLFYVFHGLLHFDVVLHDRMKASLQSPLHLLTMRFPFHRKNDLLHWMCPFLGVIEEGLIWLVLTLPGLMLVEPSEWVELAWLLTEGTHRAGI